MNPNEPVASESEKTGVQEASASTSLTLDQASAGERGAFQAVTTAFLALFCIVGLILWGLPYYYDFMVQQFGWTRGQVTFGNALSKVVVGVVFGFIAGWIVDRFGPRRLMMAGILMAGAAVIGLGYVSTLSMFRFFYFFNALGYVCGGPLPNQVLLSRWFGKSRGKAMGIAYLGIGIGGAMLPWISNALVHRFGWHMALRMLGVLIIVISFPMAFFVKEPARKIRQEDGEPVSGEATRPFKTIAFYLLALGSMCSIAAVSGTQQNLKLYFSLDQHYTQSAAARILSLILASSMIGRLLMGWLADHFPKKYVMLLIYTIVAAAIPLLFFPMSKSAMYVFTVVFGIGLGGDYMIIPLMTAELFGVRVLGRLMGVILAADGIAEAVSPWIVGNLRDASGSYHHGFLVLIAMALLGAAAVMALPRRRLES